MLTTDLNDMMVFLSIVEAGSFTLAGERLGIPKANVSRKLTRLEQSLGVTLLERSTRTQQLTVAGRKYLLHCKRIHEEVALAQTSVCQELNAYTGDLKIGASVATGQEILKPSLAKFMSKYPDISLQLNLVNRRVNFIEEGFDVLIRIGKLDDSQLIGKKLGTVQKRLYASPNYCQHEAAPLNIEQLKEHPLLLMNAVSNDSRFLLKNKTQEFEFKEKARFLVDDFSVLKEATLSGLGIGLLPSYMCQHEVNNQKLTPILADWATPALDVYALYPKNRAKIPKVKAFLTFIDELFTRRLVYQQK